jgi:hypothetical protein
MMHAQKINITSYLLRKCLFGDPGLVSVSLFCPVDSGKLEGKVLWWCGLVGGVMPIQAVYNSVNHTGPRLARTNIKCNTLSCFFYIDLKMTQ